MKRALVATTLAVAALAVPAMAQNVTRLPNVGPWGLAIDPTLNNGCFSVTSYSYPVAGALRIGYDAQLAQPDGMPVPYVELMSKAVDTVTPGYNYMLNVQFLGRPAITVGARAWMTPSGMKALNFTLTNDLYHGFVDGLEFTISFAPSLSNASIVLAGQLTGSAAAINAVTQCQAAQNLPSAPVPPTGGPAVPGAPT